MFGNNYNPYLYGGAGSGTNFGTNPYYQPYAQQQMNTQMQQTQNIQQTQPQVQQQPQQTINTNTNMIYVNGIEDVRNRVLAPNSDVFFRDNDKPLLYEKIVDGKGQFEVKTFSLADYKPKEEPKTESMSNLSNYVLKTDLEPLQAEIKDLNDKLTKLDVRNQLNSLKKDDRKEKYDESKSNESTY